MWNYLAVNGTLNLKMGGVGVIPPLTSEEILAARMPHLWPENPDAAEHTRRSIYLQVKRSLTLPMLQIFDAPDTATAAKLSLINAANGRVRTETLVAFSEDESVAIAESLPI